MMLNTLKRRPMIYLLVIAFLIGVEVFIIERWFPEFWVTWVALPGGDRRELIIGVLGASAIVTGFSGVISVFGLSADSDAFVKFRVRAGESLRKNWSAVSVAGLLSMAFSIAAALTDAFWSPTASIYILQIAILFLAENGIRSVWLLKQLVAVTDSSDVQDYAEIQGRRDMEGW